jgi:hypothetical protein
MRKEEKKMKNLETQNDNDSMPIENVAVESKPVTANQNGENENERSIGITLKFELPEYAEHIRSHGLNGRVICVGGDTSQDALLEAINAIAFVSQHIKKPGSFTTMAPEQGDWFDGWRNLMGIHEIPDGRTK